jgi:hypothetical protein
MAKSYKVAAPYVTLRWRDDRGTEVITGFYQGSPVPDTADEDNVQRLLDKGMLIDANDPVADIVAVPAGTPMPGEPPNVPVAEVPNTSFVDRIERAKESLKSGGRSRSESSDRDKSASEKALEKAVDKPAPGTTGQAQAPAQSDPKADWVKYAVSQGEDPAKAEGMSKEQLTGKYGKRTG